MYPDNGFFGALGSLGAFSFFSFFSPLALSLGILYFVVVQGERTGAARQKNGRRKLFQPHAKCTFKRPKI
jgi:hypothetical protein